MSKKKGSKFIKSIKNIFVKENDLKKDYIKFEDEEINNNSEELNDIKIKNVQGKEYYVDSFHKQDNNKEKVRIPIEEDEKVIKDEEEIDIREKERILAEKESIRIKNKIDKKYLSFEDKEVKKEYQDLKEKDNLISNIVESVKEEQEIIEDVPVYEEVVEDKIQDNGVIEVVESLTKFNQTDVLQHTKSIIEYKQLQKKISLEKEKKSKISDLITKLQNRKEVVEEVIVQDLKETIEPNKVEKIINLIDKKDSLSGIISSIQNQEKEEIQPVINKLDEENTSGDIHEKILKPLDKSNLLADIISSIEGKQEEVIEEPKKEVDKKGISNIISSLNKTTKLEEVIESISVNKHIASSLLTTTLNNIKENNKEVESIPEPLPLKPKKEEKKVKKLRGKKNIKKVEPKKDKPTVKPNTEVITVEEATAKKPNIIEVPKDNTNIIDKYTNQKETMKQRYIRLAKKPYELHYRGLKVYDFFISKTVVNFQDNVVIIGTKRFPYDGLRIKNI